MAKASEHETFSNFMPHAIASIGLSLLAIGCSDYHSKLDRNPLLAQERVLYAPGVIVKIDLSTVNTRYSPRITLEPFSTNIALRPTDIQTLKNQGTAIVCIQDPILTKTINLTDKNVPEEKVVSWLAWTSSKPLAPESAKSNLYFNGYRNDTKAAIQFFDHHNKLTNPSFTTATIDLRLMQHHETLKSVEISGIDGTPLQKSITVKEPMSEITSIASYQIPCP